MQRILIICFGGVADTMRALHKIERAYPDAGLTLLSRSVLPEEVRSIPKLVLTVYIPHRTQLLSWICNCISQARNLNFDAVFILFKHENFIRLKMPAFASHIEWGLSTDLLKVKGYLRGDTPISKAVIISPIIVSALCISTIKWYLRRWINSRKLLRE